MGKLRSSALAGLVLATGVLAQDLRKPADDEKPVSIGGEVRNSVTLAPIERAHVSVRKFANGKFDRYGVLTNAEGKFLIANLPPGTYAIFADRTGFTDLTAPSARETKLGPGEKKEDIKLKLTPTGEITGRVLDRDGAPVEGLTVSAEAGGRSKRAALTDDRGMFRLGGMAPGGYRVVAQPPRGITAPPEIRTDGTVEAHYSPTYYPGALDLKSASRVEVQAGGETGGVDIRLVSTRIVRVSGKVSGFPPGAQSVSVWLSKSPATSGGGGRTRPDGSFEIWRVDPGKYTLRANYDAGGKRMMSAPVEVEIGDADVENLALQLIAPMEIHGVLEYDDEEARKYGQPPPQAQQSGPDSQRQKQHLRSVMLRDASLDLTATAPIKEDGSFTLSQVHPGVYRATVYDGPVYVKAMEFGPVHIASSQLDLRSGAAGALTLHLATAAGAIGGVIRDDKGPAGGSVVALVEAGGGRATARIGGVKDDGTYSMLEVPPGKYRIVAYEEGDPLLDNEDMEDIGEPIEVRNYEVLTKDLKKRAVPGVK